MNAKNGKKKKNLQVTDNINSAQNVNMHHNTQTFILGSTKPPYEAFLYLIAELLVSYPSSGHSHDEDRRN